MNDVGASFQKIAKGIQNQSRPCTIVYGLVEAVNPLKVVVDQKLPLEASQLKLTRNVMDYETEISIDGGVKQSCIVYNGLKVGDKVTMIRQMGGQEYLIVDKEVV